MISVEEALAHVLALVAPLPCETEPLPQAAGRVLAEPAVAQLTQPPFDASAMDGYWLAESDARPGATLIVAGEAAAGHGFSDEIPPGHTLRIFTGAPCPARPGRVIPQEDVTRAGDTITLSKLPKTTHIRPRGQDFAEGAAHFPRRRLNARDIGLLAAMNVAQVAVHRRPVVAIIATGDELVEPGETPGADQIICSNNYLLAAEVARHGAEARMLPIARDNEASLRAVLDQAEGADLVLTSGGASVGDHDIVGKVAATMGLERSFWKVAMKPGKPLMAGRLGKAALLGLPGNPVAAAVCADVFLRPMLMKFQGLETPLTLAKAVLGCDLPPEGPRQHYQRARLTPGESLPVITPFSSQDSALLSVLAESEALLIRPAQDRPRRRGETVSYLPL
ncbi:molybdopterin molybdochelatase [Rhodobacter aestuarii]|uniref:Molybdopterin molybdenumtransferase n=1 Tax=Rhodobacter aestuarii TaxID=453582 RepID=A0A1N7NP67_9RHOB|nr:gephyrin-like molybdotransferase Glp [Rhodobacter aestuarii]PTV94652.1 molybdopterin molybdochelatase [Rhodobacter aestuarii]SIT00009.1 molybdopterin molybdochelatase [Rhodobacter aestuarii]